MWYDTDEPESTALTEAAADLRYVNLAGDTMTGALTLSGPPTVPLHAATKAYVDALPPSGITQTAADLRYVNVDGDTMTGGLHVVALGNFHSLRCQNANNTPYVEFRSNEVTPTRYGYVQGGTTQMLLQADVGDVRVRSVTAKAFLQAATGIELHMGDVAGNFVKGWAGLNTSFILPRGSLATDVEGLLQGKGFRFELGLEAEQRFRITCFGDDRAWIDNGGDAHFNGSVTLGGYTGKAIHKMAGGVLDYSPVTAGQTPITTVVDLTGLSASFTAVPERYYKITGSVQPSSTVATDTVRWHIYETGVQVQQAVVHLTTTAGHSSQRSVILAGLSGARTCKLRMERNSGTGNVTSNASATNPAFILVEDLGVL